MYLLMELCPHKTLQEMLYARKILSEFEARYFMRQLFDAFDLMHRRGIVHRDLKPPNVFIGPKMQLKIGDYGLAYNQENGKLQNKFCGTPTYMAPEVVYNNAQLKLGGKEYGREIDIWGLGVLLF